MFSHLSMFCFFSHLSLLRSLMLPGPTPLPVSHTPCLTPPPLCPTPCVPRPMSHTPYPLPCPTSMSHPPLVSPPPSCPSPPPPVSLPTSPRVPLSPSGQDASLTRPAGRIWDSSRQQSWKQVLIVVFFPLIRNKIKHYTSAVCITPNSYLIFVRVHREAF